MKRLLINMKEHVRFFRSNPGYSIRAIVRELTRAHERFLSTVTDSCALKISRLLEEPFEDVDFAEHIRQTKNILGHAAISTGDLYANKVLIRYAIVRALKPELMVETGNANGVSSCFLLLAMQKNHKGHLHSVEIDRSNVLLEGRDPGWIVAESLRLRWSIHMGASEVTLPELPKDLPPLDIFIHDSSHTYEHMELEFELALPHLRPGALLLADDAT